MKPEYGKRSRYPKLNRDANGKAVCRGCQSPVPKGKRTWCSDECYLTYGHIGHIKGQVWKRDQGCCQMCGEKAGMPEYDHIIPHSEGGLFVVENLRLLCTPCHKKRTAQWRKVRSLKRKVRSLKVTPDGQIEMRL